LPVTRLYYCSIHINYLVIAMLVF